jgi:hypothetical protein
LHAVCVCQCVPGAPNVPTPLCQVILKPRRARSRPFFPLLNSSPFHPRRDPPLYLPLASPDDLRRRVGSESLFEAVAQLTGLRELRMAVYSNADHCIPCHLSHLSALAALQRFHLEKRRAYFPEVGAPRPPVPPCASHHPPPAAAALSHLGKHLHGIKTLGHHRINTHSVRADGRRNAGIASSAARVVRPSEIPPRPRPAC